jgi:hypothetical protein
MAARGWTGLILGTGLVLAGCAVDRNAPPPGLALVDDLPPGSTGYTCRTVADSDRLTVHLQEGETMIACPPGIIPWSVYRDENRARLVARPRGWSVYAVPPAPPPRAQPAEDRGRADQPSLWGDNPLIAPLIGVGPCGGIVRRDCQPPVRRAVAAGR